VDTFYLAPENEKCPRCHVDLAGFRKGVGLYQQLAAWKNILSRAVIASNGDPFFCQPAGCQL